MLQYTECPPNLPSHPSPLTPHPSPLTPIHVRTAASELAGKELGQVDVTMRGAVSIARRLQDPLSELVKIEPKALGVGLYQVRV